jgi:MFS family permease
VSLAVASAVLTGYTLGTTSGTLVGGWVADRAKGSLFGFVTLLTLVAMALLLVLGLVRLPELVLPVVGLAAGLCIGTSRTPRDVMLKDASPPGEVGKVFGFVSAGLPLGGAITPVPMGLLIDLGYPELVLPVVAALYGLSLLCAGGTQGEKARATRPAAAE